MLFIRAYIRWIASLLLVVFVSEVFIPKHVLAVTGGPDQSQSTGGATGSSNVDPFTGDFNYSIPIMEVGGYPITLNYSSSGLTMDRDASWVGYGWSLSPGAITRSLRGLPDDFKGDSIFRSAKIEPERITSVAGGMSVEFAGFGLGKSRGIQYSNYKGIGLMSDFSVGASLGKGSGGSMTLGISISRSTFNGAGIAPNMSFGYSAHDDAKSISGGVGLGVALNSRAGLMGISFGMGLTYAEQSDKRVDKGKEVTGAVNQIGLGGGVTFAVPSYTPQFMYPMNFRNYAFRIAGGTDIISINPGLFLDGSFSHRGLHEDAVSLYNPAYGYNYHASGQKNPVALYDFNREKDGAALDEKPHLPLTVSTYDQFNVNCHGLGGTMRLHKGDISFVADPEVNWDSKSQSFGAEIGVLTTGVFNSFKAGIDYQPIITEEYTGRWKNGDVVTGTFQGKERDESEGHENTYFKFSGEKSIVDEQFFYDAIGGFKAEAVQLRGRNGDKTYQAQQSFISDSAGATRNFPSASEVVRSHRDVRANAVLNLTAKEASKVSKMSGLLSYSDYNETNKNFDSDLIPRVSAYRKAHHFSEIQVNKADGQRYIFGLPTYTAEQNDYTFNVNPTHGDDRTGLVSYSSTDISLENNQGQEKFFQHQRVPAYPNSFLLTAILSDDYADHGGDGPTPDDFGSYVKFNYTCTSANEDYDLAGYQFRAPFQKDNAVYNEAKKSPRAEDDKGIVMHGKREQWYAHSIESRNHIAVFHTSPRKDGYGAVGRDGGVDTNLSESKAYKLDSISLYTRYELEKEGLANARPLKRAHFEYDYILCPNTPNSKASNGAKLTLTGVYFTYLGSYKTKKNAYTFTYVEDGKQNEQNPPYDMRAVDRWGSYKPNSRANSSASANPYIDGYPLSNSDKSYTLQDSTLAAQYSSVWHLRKIGLPNGSEMTVTYESDDYAFVQDEIAARMYEVVGVGSQPGDWVNHNNKLYENNNSVNDYVFLNIGSTGFDVSSRDARFRQLYFPNSNQLGSENYSSPRGGNGGQISEKELQFRFAVKLGGSTTYQAMEAEKTYDFIKGYFTAIPQESGMVNDSIAYVKIRKAHPDNTLISTHPVTLATWNYCKLMEPYQVYVTDVFSASNPSVELIKQLFGSFTALAELVTGDYVQFAFHRNAQKIALNKSFVKLNTKPGYKYGGGSRIKKIEIDNAWGEMAENGQSHSYGYEYNYVTIDPSYGVPSGDGEARLISSGVASYEPFIGGEENALRGLYKYSVSKKLVPDDEHYQETPVGESFYPSPMVGYSRVQVRSLTPESEVESATGYSEYKFYTTKDYPTIVRTTGKQSRPADKSITFQKVVSLGSVNINAMESEGYSIITNDMNGKAKASYQYDGNSPSLFNAYGKSGIQLTSYASQVTPLRGKLYHYQDKTGFNNGLRGGKQNLNSKVHVIGSNGAIENKLTGLEYELIHDMRQQTHVMTNHNAMVNLHPGNILFGVWFIPVPIYTQFKEETTYRSVVTTKSVHQQGILESEETIINGNSLKSEPLLRDAITGQVVASRSQNEFRDWIYDYSYPAYWAYNEIGPSYESLGLRIANFDTDSSGIVSGLSTKQMQLLKHGGQLALISNTGTTFGWIFESESADTYIIDSKGEPIVLSNPVTAHVYRSGSRNKLGGAVQNFNFLASDEFKDTLTSSMALPAKVLNASASELNDEWQTFCCAVGSDYCKGCNGFNPFVMNLDGNWHMNRQYAFRTTRNDSATTGKSRLRASGFLENFTPYWSWSGNSLTKQPENNRWVWGSEADKINPFGQIEQTKDTLGLYASSVFGFRHSLPIATASFAKRNEIAFDGFERSDSDYQTTYKLDEQCYKASHFNLLGNNQAVRSISTIDRTTNEAHTGNYSLLIPAGQLIGINRFNTSESCSSRSEGFSEDNSAVMPGSCLDCLSDFGLDSDKKYYFSAWVKSDLNNNHNVDASIDLKIDGQTTTLTPSGSIIEGWQRVVGSFVSGNSSSSALSIYLKSGDNPTYFDDIRIQPFQSQMTTYVYDESLMRLEAELDEENFATFYDYDEQGQVIRIRKETIQGIRTIQETRSELVESQLTQP